MSRAAATLYEHQSYVGVYFVVDRDGYVIADGLTRREAEALIEAVSLTRVSR